MGNPSAHTRASPYRFFSAGAGGHKGRPYIAAARSTGAAHILPVRKKRGPVPVRHTPAGSPGGGAEHRLHVGPLGVALVNLHAVHIVAGDIVVVKGIGIGGLRRLVHHSEGDVPPRGMLLQQLLLKPEGQLAVGTVVQKKQGDLFHLRTSNSTSMSPPHTMPSSAAPGVRS